MKKIIFLIFLIFSFSCAVSKDISQLPSVGFTLTKKNIQKLGLMKPDISRKEFDKSRGEFALEMPKKYFVYPVSNCRNTLYLHMIAVIGVENDAQMQLDYRWDLFQSIVNVMNGKLDHIDVNLEFTMFSKMNKKKQLFLEECSIYIMGK